MASTVRGHTPPAWRHAMRGQGMDQAIAVLPVQRPTRSRGVVRAVLDKSSSREGSSTGGPAGSSGPNSAGTSSGGGPSSPSAGSSPIDGQKFLGMFAGAGQRTWQSRVVRAVEGAAAAEGGRVASARTALEKLFAQAQRYDERVSDPVFDEETALEEEVERIEGDLGEVLDALRRREDAVAKAEAGLREERRMVEAARVALVSKEQQLMSAQAMAGGRMDELAKVKAVIANQAKDAERVEAVLAARESELREARRQLIELEDELSSARAVVGGQDERLTQATSSLAASEARLREVQEESIKLRGEVSGLRSALMDREAEVAQASSDVAVRRQQLVLAEQDLAARTAAFRLAQEEIGLLKDQLSGRPAVGNSGAAAVELERANALLAGVERELERSQRGLVAFRGEMEQQERHLREVEVEVKRLKAELASKEETHALTRADLEKGREELSRVHAAHSALKASMVKQVQQVRELERQLGGERERAEASAAEVAALRKDSRAAAAALSDAELSLKLKEAELVAAQLEVKGARSDVAAAQAMAASKAAEAEAASRMVSSLRREVARARQQVAQKDGQIAAMGNQMREKEQALAVAGAKLRGSRVKLAQAESVVEQIAELSRLLAKTATDGMMGERFAAAAAEAEAEAVALGESSAALVGAKKELMEREVELEEMKQAKEESLVAMQCLQSELEAVRECLSEREVELEVARLSLADREANLAGLQGQWGRKEAELQRVRAELLQGVEEVGRLRDMARERVARGGGEQRESLEGEEEAVLTSLELEAARVEAGTAMAALQALSQLSSELTRTSSNQQAQQVEAALLGNAMTGVAGHAIANTSAQVPAPSPSNLDQQHKQQQQASKRLAEKDRALNMAHSAMRSLTRLTRKLVLDAAAAGAGLSQELDIAHAGGEAAGARVARAGSEPASA